MKRQLEIVPLYHHVELRRKFECFLRIDINYLSVDQIDVQEFRENPKYNDIWWNLIWYFTCADLPYEFMVPYEDQTNLKNLAAVNAHISLSVEKKQKQLQIPDNSEVINLRLKDTDGDERNP